MTQERRPNKYETERDAIRDAARELFGNSNKDVIAIADLPKAIRPYLPIDFPPLRDGEIMLGVHYLLVEGFLERKMGFFARLSP